MKTSLALLLALVTCIALAACTASSSDPTGASGDDLSADRHAKNDLPATKAAFGALLFADTNL